MSDPSASRDSKHAAAVKRTRAKDSSDQQIEAVPRAPSNVDERPLSFIQTPRLEDRFVREKECARLTGLSRVTRWRMEHAGTFPRRRQLSTNTVGWLASEIETWMRKRIEQAERA